MHEIHNRMPVMLEKCTWDQWLNPGLEDVGELQSLLKPAKKGTLEHYPVSTEVGKVSNNGHTCWNRTASRAMEGTVISNSRINHHDPLPKGTEIGRPGFAIARRLHGGMMSYAPIGYRAASSPVTQRVRGGDSNHKPTVPHDG